MVVSIYPPTLIIDIFKNFGINIIQRIHWGTIVNDKNEGVYVVSSSPLSHKNWGSSFKPKFDENEIEKWIMKLHDFQIDNKNPSLEKIKKRLIEFWLPDENIIYIGHPWE